MAEPKIVTEIDGCEVGAYELKSGIGISFLAPAATALRYTATFDRPNALSLRDALNRALGEG